MPLYPFETQLVVSGENPSIILFNATVTIFNPADTALASPLELVDPYGLPIANPIPVSAQGFIPPFQATIPQVMWAGGGYSGYISSFQGVLQAAQAAQLAAQQAAADAANAAGADIPSGGTAGQVLTKASSTNYDTVWAAGGTGGGTVTPEDIDPIVGDLVESGTGATVSALDLRYRKPGAIPIADLPAGSTVVVRKSGTTWPARPTTRSDIICIWVGADPDPAIITSGTGGALNNVDLRMAF